jgi:K+-transporting ATPase ATPase A chain
LAVGLINGIRAVHSQFRCACTRFWAASPVRRRLNCHHTTFGAIHGARLRRRTAFSRRVFGPLERWIYKLSGIDPAQEMSWKAYAIAVLVFNIIGGFALLVIELTQQWLPLNPQHLPNLPFALAVNTATSFMTNTNWQAYSGENTMSYFTQMAGLAVHNFVSAATGIAIALALARGLVRKQALSIGNFWADLTRCTLYLLLPLSILIAVVLAQQGVVQTFDAYPTATTIEGAQQQIPLGPIASQIAIKQLGTNGGGFLGQNSTHPFENPTPLTNFIELFVIFWFGSALVYMFGLMTGDRRQGWAIWWAMFVLFFAGFATLWWAELQPNPALGLATPSLEGKELRFGQFNSALFATVTTDASCGAVNTMHDSLSPLGGLVPFINMMLGEVIFGGVGAGFYGMLMFVSKRCDYLVVPVPVSTKAVAASACSLLARSRFVNGTGVAVPNW